MIVLKIVTTISIFLVLIFFGSWAMQIRDEKREKFWTRITDITGALMLLMLVGLILVMIWND
jgi:membrane-anchored protein YejM (alkaline phosphatase superfamily)